MDTPEFEKLSPALKRVAIAEDVLKQLAAERIIARRGEYLSVGEYNREAPVVRDRACSVKQLLEGAARCRACAIGSAVLALANLAPIAVGEVTNEFVSSFSINTDEAAKVLEKYFSAEQLALMEMAYEASLIFYDTHADFNDDWEDECEPWEGDRILNDIPIDVKQAAYKFTHTGKDGEEKMDDREALEKIWRNVLRNDGTFDPLDPYDAQA